MNVIERDFVNKLKQDEKNMVAFRLHPDLHKKLKLFCMQEGIKMQDFLSKTVEQAMKDDE